MNATIIQMMSRDELRELRARPSSVPCGGCSACCRRDAIALEPSDDLSRFAWHMEAGRPTLDRKPGGECVYLTAKGCGVHANAPSICKRFDCRVLYAMTPKSVRRQRVAMNPTMRDVYRAGKRRLSTLTLPERS